MSKKNQLYRFAFLFLLLAACSADLNKDAFVIKGYDCTQMKQTILEDPLEEISGITYDAQHKLFLAINDEHGAVYVLDPVTFSITSKLHFAEKGDYEEIQYFNNQIYVLRSDGQVYKMNFTGTEIFDVVVFQYTGPKAEFESFYIKNNTLVLIPKNYKQGTKNSQTLGYIIDANTGQYISENDFKLNWADVKGSVLLHPSAVAVHPQTREIYLLASIEKLLLVTDRSGKLAAEYKLDPKQFQQPEGITFDAEGNLFISNEAGEKKPTIISIPIQTKN